jgi:UDP-N-acetyl-D-galactosamine dehydrogenase
MKDHQKKLKIAIIGMGYVGLPLAIAFSKKRQVIGFDTNKKRINNLKLGHDSTCEVSKKKLLRSKKLTFTNKHNDLINCNCFIITVPTPINKNMKPDFSHIISASNSVGKLLKKKDIVIYESTVYPGATEEVCVPILEKISKLKYNSDFFVGYSPERMNPGDKKHGVENIVKITSGSNKVTANIVNKLYSSIVKVGTFKASSIKVAEAAKVIENTQRDINIALINELSLIFSRLKIGTEEVLKAASTKWNFIPFMPGFVGGHCIGVDPYYLTYKARATGYNPKIILSGRNLNNQMTKHVAKIFLKTLSKKKINLSKSRVLIMGITFKENVQDVRNTKIIDLIKILKKTCSMVDIYDPVANSQEVKKIYGLSLKKKINQNTYHGIILAVKHKQFIHMGIKKIRKFGLKNQVIYDLKYLFPLKETDIRL